jgi:16S rRNA (adenine1518-N6/adenine1519-N6)-dimethyltransferase
MSFVLKKRYGQNFLIDQNILTKITNLINSENLNILEIGPGDGKLTEKIILKKPSKLTLVEIDRELFQNLEKKYLFSSNINLINADILKYNIKCKYELIISNLPYNISSQILVKLSTMNLTPDNLILMFQKEFAHRLLEKKLNSINSLIKCFYSIKLNFNVSKNCFRPMPKVDSSVLTFKKLKKKLLEIEEINRFIIFKRNLFSHKRKSLKNLLKKYDLKHSIDLNLRVEDLKLDELVRIFRSISS